MIAEVAPKLVDEIRFMLKERLQLDSVTVADIFRKEKEDARFRLVDVAESEFYMQMCEDEEGSRCVEVALTVSEAIALALRLVKYAAEAHAKYVETL
ncbi:MAG: hypothetical protein ACO2PN_21060 [Pyrobaculum sp.]|jgi:hypothetical protein